MKKLLLLATLSGCDWYFGPPAQPPGPPDAARISDAQTLPDASTSCLSDSERVNDCELSWSGWVRDFVSQEDQAGTVVVTTAWDNLPFYPLGCPPLDSFEVTAPGFDSVQGLRCDSPSFPPIVAFVTGTQAGDGLHPFVVDARLTCPTGPQCDQIQLVIPTLSDAVALDWRAQLEADGMTDALGGGLAIVQFLEADGTPAAGVVPTLWESTTERVLEPATEVRFLAGNRLSLVRFDATTTGIAGLAIIQLPSEAGLIGGFRGTERWEPIGVLFPRGHIFFEDRTVSP